MDIEVKGKVIILKEKNKCKVIKNVIIIMLIIANLYEAFEIYAAYKNKLSIDSNMDILPWSIVINDVDIVLEKNFLINEISSLSENTAEGKIAPGSTAQILITIDALKVRKMNVKYEIEIEIENNDIGEFYIENVEELSNENIITYENNKYIGIITEEDINNGIIHNIGIDIRWKNNEENNEKDTIIARQKENNDINVNIKVKAMQYIPSDEEDTNT